jgi:hypothetical protein
MLHGPGSRPVDQTLSERLGPTNPTNSNHATRTVVIRFCFRAARVCGAAARGPTEGARHQDDVYAVGLHRQSTER